MFESLELADQNLLILINSIHSTFADHIMFYVSAIWIFFPYFFYIFYLVYKKVGIKYTAILLVFIGLVIGLCDQASNITKHSVKRYRPTHNLELKEKIHLVENYTGGQYGFFSGHAANTFGIAMFLFLLFNKQTLAFRFVFFAWASITAYSRMYMGVHYPSDIFMGTIVGILIGIFIFKLQKLFFSKKYDTIISL